MPERPDFPQEEDKVLEYWKEIDAFREQMRRSEGRKPYTFYDGPPFATGLPHYGHIAAGTIKVSQWPSLIKFEFVSHNFASYFCFIIMRIFHSVVFSFTWLFRLILLKDVMTRYATQTGHHCQRRFGWDCHGLPIEYEIDKRDNIRSSAEREEVSHT